VERLKNLKHAGNKMMFNNLQFTEQLRRNIYDGIQKDEEKDEDILIAVLQLLMQPKTGFTLLCKLQSRGFRKFENNEGFLYTLLHELEKKEWIETEWSKDHVKQYIISQKGKKMLQKAEKQSHSSSISLKNLIKGEMLYE
jgi:DNA-binding PadR family transcriptional regulator